MAGIIAELRALGKSNVAAKVEKRLAEFESFSKKPAKEWFSELCFCILTANSRAETALRIQEQLGAKGFCEACASDIKKCVISNKHRFHNNKTRFIIAAREHLDIKQKMQRLLNEKSEPAAREWLDKNIKGLGYKEASHFLRNVGCQNLAILDRHILSLMLEHGFIQEKPKSLAKKKYLETEKKFREIAKKLGMSAAELDLYMWYMKTGKVLK